MLSELALVVAAAAAAAGAAGADNPDERHFEDVTGDLPDEPVTAVAIDPRDDQVVYAGMDGFLFKTDDAGESWRPVLSFPRGVALDATDTEVRSRGADLFTEQNALNGDFEDGSGGSDPTVADDPNEDGEDTGEFDPASSGSADRGVDQPGVLPDGDVLTQEGFDVEAWPREGPGVRAILFVPGSAVLYVATPRGLYRSTGSGEAFERVTIPGGALENDVRDVAIDPRRPSRLYVATGAGLYVSRDGGSTLARAGGAVGDSNVQCVAAGVVDDAVHVLVGTTSGLYRSTNDGGEFNQMLLKGASSSFGVSSLTLTPNGEMTYAGTAVGVFAGERGSPILEQFGGLPSLMVSAVSADPRAPRRIAVGTISRGVLFSQDAGLTQLPADNVPAGEVFAIARPTRDPAALFIATDRGLFRSMPGSGIVVSTSALKKLRAQWAGEPSLQQTVEDALTFADIAPTRFGEMRARASWAAILPRMQVRYLLEVGRTERGQTYLRAGDDLPTGVSPDPNDVIVTGNTDIVLLTPTEGIRHSGWLVLTWDLDRLVLNPDELRAGRQMPFQHRAERRIVEHVQEAFSARRRLMTEMSMRANSKRASAKALVRDQLRVDELTAELDGATGGKFTVPARSTVPSEPQ